MATIEQLPDNPNILLLLGSDVYSADFRFILSGIENSPVNMDSHDFWIIHRAGEVNNSAYSTNCATENSRLKKCININFDFSGTDLNAAAGYMETFLHEIFHYWVVPFFSMGVGNPETVTMTRNSVDFINSFFISETLPPLCLIAKSNSHWTCFMMSGQTSYEAIDWIPQREFALEGFDHRGEENENILFEYINNPTPAYITGNIGEHSNVNVAAPLSDIDKVILGIKQPAEAYRSNNNTFYELQPQWMNNIDVMTGICLVFGLNDVVHFGFKDGHEKLAVMRQGSVLAEIEIARFYTPDIMMNFNTHIALRIIRRGNTYYCQSKMEFSNPGCLASILSGLRLYNPPPRVDLFSETGNPPASPPAVINRLTDWITVLSFAATASTPFAGGYMVKTWGEKPPMVDTHFTSFQVKEGNSAIRTIDTVPSEPFTAADYTTLLDDNFIFHLPKEGPALIPGTELCNLIIAASTPAGEVGNHNNNRTIDEAPKLLTRLANTDFVIGGKVKIKRSAMAPHAFGAATGSKLWAFRRARKLVTNGQPNIFFDPNTIALQQNNSPYKCAFIILAPDRASVSQQEIDNVEKYRQACDTFVRLATDGMRSIDTTL